MCLLGKCKHGYCQVAWLLGWQCEIYILNRFFLIVVVEEKEEEAEAATPPVTLDVPAATKTKAKYHKYRANFEFEARRPDELTIHPGDIILVHFLLIIRDSYH